LGYFAANREDRMVRALIGAVLGAVAMFVIGFVFFATPLSKLGTASLDDHQAAAIQQVLAANLSRTGTYFVPDPGTRAQSEMYSRGPVATVHYNMNGFSPVDPGALLAGFVHMLIVALLGALALQRMSRYVTALADQAKIAGATILAAAAFMRLGEPIWYHYDWSQAIYLFVADVVSLGAAAFIILQLLPKARVERPTVAS
jgi:membrane protein YqaA with SNARE-associated domain